MKDQARLVVLNKKWLEVTYCKGCLTYVFLSQSGTRVEACLLPDQTSETIARELVAGGIRLTWSNSETAFRSCSNSLSVVIQDVCNMTKLYHYLVWWRTLVIQSVQCCQSIVENLGLVCLQQLASLCITSEPNLTNLQEK